VLQWPCRGHGGAAHHLARAAAGVMLCNRVSVWWQHTTPAVLCYYFLKVRVVCFGPMLLRENQTSPFPLSWERYSGLFVLCHGVT
jgi:hypothetical protein